MTIRLAKDSYKVSTHVRRTIRRNRKYLPQDFGRCPRLEKRNIFAEVQFLLPPFIRKVMPSCAFYSPPTARQKILNTIVCIMVKKTGYKPSTAQSYNDFTEVHLTGAMLDSCTDERISVKYWKKICFNIPSRMVLNSSITYKESKPISKLDYTVKITDALSEEWLQEKNSAAGVSGTGNKETASKH